MHTAGARSCLGSRHTAVAWLGAGLLALTPLTALAQSNIQREASFGQTHSHTSWSLDAYIIGNHVAGPEEEYKFSLGQPTTHPAGFEVKLRRQLDFHGVTGHAEYVGMTSLANDPSSPVSKFTTFVAYEWTSAAMTMRVPAAFAFTGEIKQKEGIST